MPTKGTYEYESSLLFALYIYLLVLYEGSLFVCLVGLSILDVSTLSHHSESS